MRMTHEEQKKVAYYSMCAYASHNKRNMSADEFFRLKTAVKESKTLTSFITDLKKRSR